MATDHCSWTRRNAEATPSGENGCRAAVAAVAVFCGRRFVIVFTMCKLAEVLSANLRRTR